MDTQVRITLHPSRTYFVLLSAAVLVLILLISVLPVANGWHSLGYLAVLAITTWLFWRDVVLQSGWSCRALVCDKNREVILGMGNGEQVSGELCADTLVSPWLVLLNVTTVSHGRRSLLLFPDAMAAEDYRRLRVLLRNSESHHS